MKTEVKVGWYAFEGGKFSQDPKAYPNLQGVVAWLNPDPNAPKGKRGLILTPYEVIESWADKYCVTGICDNEDGQANTKGLIAYGKKHDIKFLAAEWCYAYSNNGVKPGEGFLPALNQLRRIVDNRDIINSSLKKIGGRILKDWICSSSEYSYYGAWYVYAYSGYVDWTSKYYNYSYVRCVLAF